MKIEEDDEESQENNGFIEIESSKLLLDNKMKIYTIYSPPAIAHNIKFVDCRIACKFGRIMSSSTVHIGHIDPRNYLHRHSMDNPSWEVLELAI